MIRSNEYNKVIIIGAPRSGTNMLRDVLTGMPGIATWPCDEINYIWRHGNPGYKSDEFPEELARPDVIKYIRKKFDWVARKYNAHTVIEKTCANSLRVPFINKVLPESKFIFIRRDGIDVVHSAMERWKAPLDIPYLLSKARFVPFTDLPFYAFRYFANRLHQLWSREGRLAFWGPQLDSMNELLVEHSLDEVCALQWKECVESAADTFDKIPEERWIEVGYEDFVKDPENEVRKILKFLDIEMDEDSLKRATGTVKRGSVKKGRTALAEDTIHRLEDLIHRTLKRFGYV